MTASAFFSNIQSDIFYTSIDCTNIPNKALLNPFVKHEHYIKDIFEDSLELSKQFDVVFIDIEPHGKEIQVYEKIKHWMKPTHLCILKHVAFIDMFGSTFADRFIQKYYT